MLGFIAGAFAWGAVKALATGARRDHSIHISHLAFGALEEEVIFRGLIERGLLRGAVDLDSTTANLIQTGAFVTAHDGGPIRLADVALGGWVYSKAADRFGLVGSAATHFAHNLGAHLFSK